MKPSHRPLFTAILIGLFMVSCQKTGGLDSLKVSDEVLQAAHYVEISTLTYNSKGEESLFTGSEAPSGGLLYRATGTQAFPEALHWPQEAFEGAQYINSLSGGNKILSKFMGNLSPATLPEIHHWDFQMAFADGTWPQNVATRRFQDKKYLTSSKTAYDKSGSEVYLSGNWVRYESASSDTNSYDDSITYTQEVEVSYDSTSDLPLELVITNKAKSNSGSGGTGSYLEQTYLYEADSSNDLHILTSYDSQELVSGGLASRGKLAVTKTKSQEGNKVTYVTTSTCTNRSGTKTTFSFPPSGNIKACLGILLDKSTYSKEVQTHELNPDKLQETTTTLYYAKGTDSLPIFKAVQILDWSEWQIKKKKALSFGGFILDSTTDLSTDTSGDASNDNVLAYQEEVEYDDGEMTDLTRYYWLSGAYKFFYSLSSSTSDKTKLVYYRPLTGLDDEVFKTIYDDTGRVIQKEHYKLTKGGTAVSACLEDKLVYDYDTNSDGERVFTLTKYLCSGSASFASSAYQMEEYTYNSKGQKTSWTLYKTSGSSTSLALADYLTWTYATSGQLETQVYYSIGSDSSKTKVGTLTHYYDDADYLSYRKFTDLNSNLCKSGDFDSSGNCLYACSSGSACYEKLTRTYK